MFLSRRDSFSPQIGKAFEVPVSGGLMTALQRLLRGGRSSASARAGNRVADPQHPSCHPHDWCRADGRAEGVVRT